MAWRGGGEARTVWAWRGSVWHGHGWVQHTWVLKGPRSSLRSGAFVMP
jgi:hypothetical protein